MKMGEESLTIFVDKRKLSKNSDASDSNANSTSVSLETLHQLAASYFIDRESTLRKLHHSQIASTAIKYSGIRCPRCFSTPGVPVLRSALQTPSVLQCPRDLRASVHTVYSVLLHPGASVL
ncbi:UNVERIFIED_CONTAM: hypothetical protein FKN15_045954 [Acipenser sinensis]